MQGEVDEELGLGLWFGTTLFAATGQTLFEAACTALGEVGFLFLFFVEAGMPIPYFDKHAGMGRDGLSLMENAMAFYFFVSWYV